MHRTMADVPASMREDTTNLISATSPPTITTTLSPSHHSRDDVQQVWRKIENKLKFVEWIRNTKWMNQRPSKNPYTPTNVI